MKIYEKTATRIMLISDTIICLSALIIGFCSALLIGKMTDLDTIGLIIAFLICFPGLPIIGLISTVIVNRAIEKYYKKLVSMHEEIDRLTAEVNTLTKKLYE